MLVDVSGHQPPFRVLSQFPDPKSPVLLFVKLGGEFFLFHPSGGWKAGDKPA